MKKLLTSILFLTATKLSVSQNSSIYNLRSDTMDVLHYTVNLEITDFVTNVIKGHTAVKASPKINNRNSISLDLLKMTIDSIKMGGTTLAYNYNDTLLVSFFPAPKNDIDTFTVNVYYHGVPQDDPSNWGGWYVQSGYAYNLGVGFESLPHTFGRVWHPCVDNFTERATYTIVITSTGGKIGYSNGYLDKDTTIGANRIRTWKLEESIPSYLACVAVNNYVHVNQKYISTVTGDTTPVMLISLAADTTDFKNSFVNLASAIQAFEECYGPYRWNKVGYIAVPFNAGAMEHATAIAYPLFAVNGNISQETLMAHELSHHWWGDLVTCETAEEMWINEGMARFSEALFLEKKYNYTQYINNIKANHKAVLWKAHVDDGGYYPLNAVPQNVTYGSHSYNKGADMAHNMRTYMGDSLFFAGLKTITANNQFKNINSIEFRDQLNALPGVNVTDFFDDWIYDIGWPVFVIDSISYTGTVPNLTATLHIRQKLRATSSYFSNVPMQVTFRDGFTTHHANVVLNGQFTTVTVNNVPFIPQFVYLNDDNKMSHGVTGENNMVKTIGLKSLSYANFSFQVTSVTDSVWVRAESYWTGADNFLSNQFTYVISPDRYWRIYMSDPSKFTAQGRFSYNGTTSASGHLDNGLMVNWGTVNFREDSLHLFYRPNSGSDWTECTGYYFSYGAMADKAGTVFIDSIKNGEYALGFKVSSTGIPEKKINRNAFKVYPNPGDGLVTIETNELGDDRKRVVIVDEAGREIINQDMDKNILSLRIKHKGLLLVSVYANNELVGTQKLVVR